MNDTFDKIVYSYFRGATKESFFYKNKEYKSIEKFNVSSLLYRGLFCVSHCGGCCPKFSLDYLPSEVTEETKKKLKLSERVVKFNSKEYTLFSDLQKYNNNHHCKYLNKENGYCTIHGYHPFSCDFEILRFLIFSKERKVNFLTKYYGRGWNMLLYDEKSRGALCKINLKYDLNDIKRKLLRLKDWFDYFEIPNNYINDLLQKELPFVGTLTLKGDLNGKRKLF